jgi:predicted RNA-binding protein YlxR (DUF448 family)
MLPKSELIRVARSAEGKIVIDIKHKAGGRGAYICRSEECRTKLQKQKSLNRAFKRQVSDQVYEELSKIKGDTTKEI